jgi:hypothetical protein
MKAHYQCPRCKGTQFQIVVECLADVQFLPDGDHNMLDGPYGDTEWDDESNVICQKNHNEGCGWSGQLKELV